MTKQFVLICWIILNWTPSFAQENYLYESLEEALAANPDSVFRLNLSRSQFKAVPEEVMRFKNLRELDLSKNKLTELPVTFIFAHLEILHLTKNKFEIFPTVLCSNTALTQLFMGKNRLSELPNCIGELKELVILDVWFNTIAVIPESMVELKKLRAVDFRGMNYSEEFQEKWRKLLPWVTIEFDMGCDCGL